MKKRHENPGQENPVGAARGKFLSDKRSAIAMEFALVSPVLLTLLFGIVQFGFFFHAQANMGDTVREAARQLAVGAATIGGTSSCASSSSGTAEAVACGKITGLSLARITVTACDPDNADASLCPEADDVAVKLSIPRSSIAYVDILGLFNSGKLEAQVTMRKEGS